MSEKRSGALVRGAMRPAYIATLLGVAGALVPVAALARGASAAGQAAGQASPEERLGVERKALVEELRREGITDAGVLDAIGRVPRHEFVPESSMGEAYRNHPLQIGDGQTISQPYVVAFMTEAAHVSRASNVLEIGTGSGYQAAVLADILGLGHDASGSGGR